MGLNPTSASTSKFTIFIFHIKRQFQVSIFQETAMDQAHRGIINKNIVSLSKDMDFDSVSIFLLSEQIFENHHIEEYKAEKTQKKRNEQLLMNIQGRGPKAFQCLVDALVDANQPYLAEKLAYSSTDARPGRHEQGATPHEPVLPPQSNSGYFGSGQMDTSSSDVPMASVYRMSSYPRGKALIINNKIFDKMKPRTGTDVDRDNLKSIFYNLRFCVDVKNDLRAVEMEHIIDSLSSFDHSPFDCMILAILSHGTEGAVYGTDGDPPNKGEGLVMIENIISSFNADRNTTLVGKPKLFFIQACRGEGKDAGVDAPDGIGPTGDGVVLYDLKKEAQLLLPTLESADGLGSVKSKLPKHGDMLLGYSTVPGLVAWRNTEEGSRFVQGMNEIIPQHARNEDLLSMMTMVNDKVSTHPGNYKQASVCVSTLRKKLYFFPSQ